MELLLIRVEKNISRGARAISFRTSEARRCRECITSTGPECAENRWSEDRLYHNVCTLRWCDTVRKMCCWYSRSNSRQILGFSCERRTRPPTSFCRGLWAQTWVAATMPFMNYGDGDDDDDDDDDGCRATGEAAAFTLRCASSPRRQRTADTATANGGGTATLLRRLRWWRVVTNRSF
jgi:hypothetical protein